MKEATKIDNKLGNRQCVNVSKKRKWILMAMFFFLRKNREDRDRVKSVYEIRVAMKAIVICNKWMCVCVEQSNFALCTASWITNKIALNENMEHQRRHTSTYTHIQWTKKKPECSCRRATSISITFKASWKHHQHCHYDWQDCKSWAVAFAPTAPDRCCRYVGAAAWRAERENRQKYISQNVDR